MSANLHLALLNCLDEATTGIGLFDPDDRLDYANHHFRVAYALAPDARACARH